MSKKIKTIIIIELQVILILLIVGLNKVSKLDQKVYNTNKFVHEVLTDKRVEELKQVNADDIIIGDNQALVTMIVFSRYRCSACKTFYQEIYPKLVTNYVDNGLLRIVIRQMSSKSMPNILYASKAALFAFQNGFYENFNIQIHSLYPELDNELIDELVSQYNSDEEAYKKFIADETIEEQLINSAVNARVAGVKGTPSFIIGETKFQGTRPYKRFEKLINESIENESCD